MRCVLITGGSRGIGASTALACARRRLGVILTWNSQPEAARKIVSQIQAEGGKVIALPLNVGHVGGFSAFRSELEQTMKRQWNAEWLDALVNNAGYGSIIFLPPSRKRSSTA